MKELDFSAFPPGTITEYTTLVCLACIFDIFTKQIGLAPRSAYSEIKRYSPTVEELTSRKAVRPFFDSDEKHPRCPYCNAAKRWHARLDTYAIEGGKTTDAPRRKFVKSIEKKKDQFAVIELKSDRRSAFFDWLDTLRNQLDLEDPVSSLPRRGLTLNERRPSRTGASCLKECVTCGLRLVWKMVGNARVQDSFWRRHSTMRACWFNILSVDRTNTAGGRWKAG
ncbi:MAG TPA: hypothetical protein VIT88_10715 [Pyrinomonadaceae bacterium]